MTGRTITAAAEAVITAPNVGVCVLVELAFPSGFLHFTNAGRSIQHAGYTWLGAGHLAQIENVSEVVGVQAAALAVRFSGLDPAYVSAILNDNYADARGRIWIAPCVDEVPVANPILIFSGTMDEPTITLGSTVSISLTLENAFADWDRPRSRTYSDADQQHYHPGDLFFEHAATLESISIEWGTYRGPVAPDPLKILNRNVDRVARFIPGAKQLVVDPLRNLGNTIGKLFGF